MNSTIRVLQVNVNTSFYRIDRYKLGDFFGPVDLGLHLSGKNNGLNIGVGLFAGSILPGSNRLIFSGFSPCWGGFYISSMGGAGLEFNNLGINLLSIIGKSATPSILYLNRNHGEEIQVELLPIKPDDIWASGRQGVYSMMDFTFQEFGDKFGSKPRILATGPAARSTDMGAICSAAIRDNKITNVDTWVGRGGLGSKLYQEHGIAAIIYGGTHLEEDFRDRSVADKWFKDKYDQILAVKDFEATTKYRFDPKFQTGGTLGVNYANISGRLIAFNYKSIYFNEQERLDLHKNFILDHYLKQFNEETIITKQQKTCGEPCSALCKKMNGEYKKDYEPYQTLGPLCGIFDQRSAEKLVHHADMLGFDAISAGGVLSWLMECLDEDLLSPEEVGVSRKPKFDLDNFDLINDSSLNSEIGIELLDSINQNRGILNFAEGARKFGRKISRQKGKEILDKFLYIAFARKGWMVPNQYWTPGALSPMAIMGKYYMYYGNEFFRPRDLGRLSAERFQAELVMDNLGVCRFHRGWAEDMLPEIMDKIYNLKEEFIHNINMTASRINSRNASVYWESERNLDFVMCFLKRKIEVDKSDDPQLKLWLSRFEENKSEAGLDFWYEIHKGIQESLREF
ncbi:MAG: aldehyde ferredoxin oxidoreductase N-terminal domain-containing protein [Candidatus Stygibacter australis]|nr:aldehyde ferredoxin oxidoreductase N-terminal domain-containing protein [Candidatus Stygibacter australis]MDP8321702.1 aldehyde ferredoxin oxidoreductase N-terminal domain-containing protein [Candidatus Stygibacter australis]